ncbi:MAG: hypothetical protein F4Y47_11980 [Acidobacteriia bacterium]|nr:hypothetical protein [Terriglobia bacterium]MYG02114.1 hypothetical protein [Terriglobia bacterium]MYK10242.1 hypothetical protein [Terriglobia bacterium]
MPLALVLLSLFACATAAGQINSVEPVGTELRSDDLPDIAAADDGTLWLVWMSHDARRDEINLRQYRDGNWSNVLLIPSGDGDVWLPQVALDSQNRVWVVWSARRNGNWDLYARRYDPAAESWGDLARLTDHRLPDIYPSLAARDGKLAVAWQGFRGSESDILLRTFSEGEWSETVSVSGRPGNDWSPTVALDSQGTVWVAYDSYRNGNYDVYLVGLRDGRTAVAEMAVAETPLFEARPSVAVDLDDRVWVAWESGGANWGKDNGYNYRYQMPASKTELPCGTCFGPGVMLGAERTIHLRAFADGRLQATARPVQAAFEADAGRYVYRPQVLLDASGNLLVAAKCLLGEGATRRRGWEYRLTRYDGGGWSAPEAVPNSKGRLSTWLRSAVASDGSLWLVWPTDNRRENYLTRPVRFQVYAGKTTSAGPPDRIQLSQPETPSVEAAPGHADEPGDLAAIRSYRAEIQGRAARIVRGDLHRHTELSWDAGGTIDGSLPEFYRYMLDAASMDFGASTDHQGGAHDYWWWYSQKMTDMYHLPGTYVSLFGYERSVNYPMGHHNVFFADRTGEVVPFYLKRWVPGYLLTDQANRGDQPGVAPPQERDEDNDVFDARVTANDTLLLFEQVRRMGGVAIAHTSATNMGTDWRFHDPEAAPVVEIFQGDRTSYEQDGAPLSARSPAPQDAPGGYRPAGFVNHALAKGYTLGTIASSDHYSTHYSYAMVYATSFTRQGVLDAIRRRHTYGATDNIILDVRMGGHFMGDRFRTSDAQPLRVRVRGTGEIARVHILRDGQLAHTHRPAAQEADFEYTDADFGGTGSSHYYYVRVEQADGQVAWGSPLWVDY